MLSPRDCLGKSKNEVYGWVRVAKADRSLTKQDRTIGAHAMIYVVHFSDGKTAQVHAANELQARRIVLAQFRGRIVAAITRGGLLDLSFRRPPVEAWKS
jgi:hypothetical protein